MNEVSGRQTGGVQEKEDLNLSAPEESGRQGTERYMDTSTAKLSGLWMKY